MTRIATTVLCFLLAGCSGWVVIISPTGVACTTSLDPFPSPTRPPPPRSISTGATIHGTLSACHPADEFYVTVVADGSLVVRVGWDVGYTGTIMLVSIDGAAFRGQAPDWSPVVARVPATRGRQYHVRVAMQGADPVDGNLYQMTTAVE